MGAKQQRQELISTLLRTEVISDQEGLRKALHARGMKSTQATLSRDFAELGVRRINTPSGKPRYVIPMDVSPKKEETHPKEHVPGRVTEVEFSGRFLVLKTAPACALSLAMEIDRQNSPLIAGTIAGHDTILVIPRDGCEREDLMHVLQNLLKGAV